MVLALFLFILIKWQIISGIRNAECVENEVDESVSGDHDEHTKESPENFPLAFIATAINSLGRDEFDYPPEEDHESNGKDQENQRIQYVPTDLVE